MTKKKFYITTAIDYTNDVIHIGHSYQKMLADALARYHRIAGDETHFLMGTDEHGQKVETSANEKNIKPKEFVDKIAKANIAEWKALDISYDRFIRTTDKDHVKFAQEFYLKSKKVGDIYLDKYEGLYCEGCESFIEESELVDGKCPFHPTKKPQQIEEENYFFRLSKFQNFLIKHIENNPDFIIPEKRRNEVLSFIKSGLKDFSVSRQNVTWGIPVPDDPKHTIYVWFDALLNYLTYGNQEKCWPADVHVLGKDNIRFHAIYWPAMLKSAGYELPKTIFIHDFISLEGQKISKSLGNVIKPSVLVKKYGTDAVRYFFLRYGPLNEDVDVSTKRIEQIYSADLANGLGNLVARVVGLSKNTKNKTPSTKPVFSKEVVVALDKYQVDKALTYIWSQIKDADVLINKQVVWSLKGKQKEDAITDLVKRVRQIAHDLKPFLDETSENIEKQFGGEEVKTNKALFPRLE